MHKKASFMTRNASLLLEFSSEFATGTKFEGKEVVAMWESHDESLVKSRFKIGQEGCHWFDGPGSHEGLLELPWEEGPGRHATNKMKRGGRSGTRTDR